VDFTLDFSDSFFSVSAQLQSVPSFSCSDTQSRMFFFVPVSSLVFPCCFFMPLVLSAQELVFLLNYFFLIMLVLSMASIFGRSFHLAWIFLRHQVLQFTAISALYPVCCSFFFWFQLRLLI
jgi:hypothetical protein